jgi:hypothetical protein
MRTEENFNLFYQRVESFRKEIGGEEPSLPRKRRRPHRYESGDAEPHHHSTAQDHYRIVYFEVIDLVVNGITSRFEQPGYTKYSKLESLLLKAASREDSSEELNKSLLLMKMTLMQHSSLHSYKYLAPASLTRQ